MEFKYRKYTARKKSKLLYKNRRISKKNKTRKRIKILGTKQKKRLSYFRVKKDGGFTTPNKPTRPAENRYSGDPGIDTPDVNTPDDSWTSPAENRYSGDPGIDTPEDVSKNRNNMYNSKYDDTKRKISF